MSELYYANVAFHVLAAIVWLGGMFFIAAVGEVERDATLNGTMVPPGGGAR